MRSDNTTMQAHSTNPLDVLKAIMPRCKAETVYSSITTIVNSIFQVPETCEASYNSVEKWFELTYTNYDGATTTVRVKYDFIGRHINIESITFK